MKNLLWLDLETTGLDPERDRILMVAAAWAEDDGSLIDWSEWVIRHDVPLPPMEEVVRKMHTENGLLARVRDPREAVGFEEMHRQLLGFITLGRSPLLLDLSTKPILAGNSIHFDRGFLKAHIPLVDAALHYRMLDVSALKVAAQVWGLPEPEKVKKHLALDDIKASIAEFMHWRTAFGLGETK